MSANRIVLKSSGVPVFEELKAGGAITPGMLVKENSSGLAVVHATATGVHEKLFAVEDALRGKTIDDAYASGDPVALIVAGRGTVINALLAPGESVVPGDFVASKGNGALEKSTTNPVGIALDTLNQSDSNETENARLRVRIL